MSAPKPTLPTDSAARKDVPLARGVLDYFPAALAAVARLSKAGNDKHNPGEPMHHARGKSTDHADCIMRHLADRGTVDPEDGIRHAVKVAWRALALLQEELEAAGEAPLARGARLPERKVVTAAEGNTIVEACRKASDTYWARDAEPRPYDDLRRLQRVREKYGYSADDLTAELAAAREINATYWASAARFGYTAEEIADAKAASIKPPFEKAFETLQAERKRISTPPARPVGAQCRFAGCNCKGDW